MGELEARYIDGAVNVFFGRIGRLYWKNNYYGNNIKCLFTIVGPDQEPQTKVCSIKKELAQNWCTQWCTHIT